MTCVTRRQFLRTPADPSCATTQENKMPVARTPTNRELLAAKQAQAPLSARPAQAVAVATAAPSKAVKVPTNQDYRSRYLDEIAPASVVGRMIKFNKEGKFCTSDDGAELPEDAEFIVLADQTLCGWVKFNGIGEPPDRVMGLLYDGFEVPPRESLGDDDPKEWDLGLDNQPSDPWQSHLYIVLQKTDTAELFTFVTSSKTGRRAAGNLLRHFDRMQRTNPGEFPVVRLRTGGFEHRDSRVGFVSVPVFVVCGRAPRDSVAVPDTSLETFLGDKINL
jgi:hypothetical protein